MNKIEIAKIIRNGGATLNRQGEKVNFSRGYQASKKDCYTIGVEKVDKISKAVNELLNRIGRDEYVGLWVDSGLVYIDISENIKNRKKALNIGTARHQISIFDWANDICIYCKEAR